MSLKPPFPEGHTLIQKPPAAQFPATLLSSSPSGLSKPSRNQNSGPSKPSFRLLQGHFSHLGDFAPVGNPDTRMGAQVLIHQEPCSRVEVPSEVWGRGHSPILRPPTSRQQSASLPPSFLAHSQAAGINYTSSGNRCSPPAGILG